MPTRVGLGKTVAYDDVVSPLASELTEPQRALAEIVALEKLEPAVLGALPEVFGPTAITNGTAILQHFDSLAIARAASASVAKAAALEAKKKPAKTKTKKAPKAKAPPKTKTKQAPKAKARR